MGLSAYFSAGCVQFPVNRKGISMVTPATVAHAHKLGLQVHAWTINDESTMHDLIDMGVDGIMTDDCALLKSVLIERNKWA
jgi:glycerophosphoryl diester phosphodiesterase